jgi:hypothetical protein
MAYSVRVVKVGEVEVPGPELFWMSEWDNWFTLSINVVVVQGDGVVALVNTGAPDDLSPINDVWTQALGERATYKRSDDEAIEAQLAAVGIAPADVTHLIVTPFQLYSTGGIKRFPNAQICLSRTGWVHFHTTHQHPHDNRWTSISPDVLTYLVVDAWDRVRLLEDEDEVAPGLRTWWAGNHHRASIAVEIDSNAGVVVASDAFFYYENVEDGRPLGISENMYEGIAAYERTRTVADHIVPLYDPRVFDRYADGIIK